MRVRCFSVRLKSLTQISDKCYKAEDWQGNEDLIPSSQVFGQDYEVRKSEAYWISAWILEKKEIEYSTKKTAWLKDEFSKPQIIKKEYDDIIIERHIPKKIDFTELKPNKELLR